MAKNLWHRANTVATCQKGIDRPMGGLLFIWLLNMGTFIEIVRLLIEHDSFLVVTDKNGLTVWDVASANGHQDICRELEKSLQSVIPLSLSEANRQKALATGLLLMAVYNELQEQLRSLTEDMKQGCRKGVHSFEEITQAILSGVAVY